MNLGNPQESTVLDLATTIAGLVGTDPGVRFVDRPVDDPGVRRPEITRARELLGWEPQVPLDEALRRTIAWFREQPVGATTG